MHKFSQLIYLISLFVLLGSCGRSELSLEFNGPVIAGRAIPLVGLLAAKEDNLFLKSAYASCEGVARLYLIDDQGDVSTVPLASTNLTSNAQFVFYVNELNLEVTLDQIKYVIGVEGCGQTYYRLVTAYNEQQNVDYATTLIEASLRASTLDGLLAVEPSKVEAFMQKLSGVSPVSVYESIVDDVELREEFQIIFATDPVELQKAAPKINSLTTHSFVLENNANQFTVSATHWDPNYNILHIWKKDGVTVSTAASWNFTPSGDEQGDYTISLFVGKNDGSGAIDITYPFINKTFSVTVDNSTLPLSPEFSSGSAITTSRNIVLNLNTGLALANCDSFSALAITENQTLPPTNLALFSISCDTAVTQTVDYTLATASDGEKNIRIWAIDSSGTISSLYSEDTVILDTASPSIALDSVPNLLQGGSTLNVTFSASDDGSGISSSTLSFAEDGVTFVDITTLTPAEQSYTWTIPSINSVNSKLKLIVTDVAGNLSEVLSNNFNIDSTPPASPSVSIGSGYTASTSLVFTASSCLDTPSIFINEGGTPSSSDSGWQACTTTSDALTYTLANSTEELKSIKVWSKDAAGNISTLSTDLTTIYDVTDPLLNVSFSGNYEGGTTQTVSWTLTELNGNSSQSFNLEYFDGSIWQPMTTVSLTDGPHTAALFSYNWTLPIDVNSNLVKVRVSFSDLAGNATSAESSVFTIDNAAPTITGMNINEGAASTNNNNILIDLTATDLSNISHFCLQLNDEVPPTLSDSCWVPVNAPLPGLPLSQSLNLNDFNYLIGASTGFYTVYAFAKDVYNKISSLSSGGIGTLNVDKDSIQYDPGNPPVVSNILSTSVSAPNDPPTVDQLILPVGSDVYIKWRATDVEGLAATPITLYYTSDDLHYTLIATNLLNGSNGGCVLDEVSTTADDQATGCYIWSSGSPLDTYYKIKVVAVDLSSMQASAQSTAINVSEINFLAGNTDPGTDNAAVSAMFVNEISSITSYPDVGSLLVAPGGIVYFRDVDRGLIMVDPSDGVQRLLIPTTGTSSGDGGPISGATLKYPVKIALDYQNGILIYDFDRIRRVNTAVSPMTIDTIIGGGASYDDNIDPLLVKLDSVGLLTGLYAKFLTLIPLPNGDIYFRSDNISSTIAAGARVRVYDASVNKVTSIYPTGIGTYDNASKDISECRILNFALTFNPLTSDITSAHAGLSACTLTGLADYTSVNLNPSNWTAEAPHTALSGYLVSQYVTISGRDGNLFAVVPRYKVNKKYNIVTRAWEDYLGNGLWGSCADGTPKASCSIISVDLFVTATGQPYFIDLGKIRTLNEVDEVITLMGQSYFHGDGESSLNARFGLVKEIKMWNDGGTDKLVILDTQEKRFREVSLAPGGTIETIAGNGTEATPDTVNPATGMGIRLLHGNSSTNDLFQVNNSDGSVYFTRYGYTIARLNRATNLWEDIVGGGATPYFSADGLPGSEVNFDAYTMTYMPNILGFDGTNILAGKSRYDLTQLDGFLKLYSITDGTQAHLLGKLGTITSPYVWCADGTANDNCEIAPATAAGNYYLPFIYDSFNAPARWVSMDISKTRVAAIAVGGTLTTIATLPRTVWSFTYRHDASNNKIYYCAQSSKSLYVYDIDTATETAFPWPIPGMTCEPHSLLWDAGRNSLIFPYKQNGLMGVAEYINPP